MVPGDVDEDVVTSRRVADAEAVEAAFDQGDAQPHGCDGTQVASWAVRLRFEMEMGRLAMDADTWDGAHVGEKPVQDGGCPFTAVGIEHLT